MVPNTFLRFASVASVVALAGCVAPDGDLAASPALVGLTLDASTDLLSQRQSAVSGTIELGWLDQKLVDLTILDNGTPVYTTSLEARNLVLPYDAVVDLLSGGPNALTAEANYAGQTVTASAVVEVPGALQALDLTAEGLVSSAEVTVSGGADLGFVSDQPVSLLLTVDGSVAVSRSLDAATTRVEFSEPVVLPSAGPHVVEARVSYEGAALAQSTVVVVEPPDPTVALPAWTTAFTPGVEMRASGSLDVSAPAPWSVAAVRASTDGGATWWDLAPGAGTTWDVAVVNPDVVSQPVRFAVDTVHHGVVHTTTWDDELAVDPVFDCNNPGSMSPTTEMIANHNTEVRSMIGYFGDPDGPHAFTFTIDASVPGDGPYQVNAIVRQRGRFSIDAEYNVDQLDNCGFDGCTIDYDLTASMDGQVWCAETNFGVVRDY